jgi:hypothetical protein
VLQLLRPCAARGSAGRGNRRQKGNVPVDVPAAELATNWDLQAFFALTPRDQRENVNPITLPVSFPISFALYCIEQREVYVGQYHGVLDISIIEPPGKK